MLHIFVLFQFNHEDSPAAVTGIEGDVADILLPCVGDIVQHSDSTGMPFEGKVTHRIFRYDLAAGSALSGAIAVTLWLERTVVQ